MKQEELEEVIRKHKLWLNNEEEGVRADLGGANLIGANLIDADLRYANLGGADLRGSDLRDSNLDYSCFPLCCGGIGWRADKNLPNMLAAFICSMKCDDEIVKEMQEKLLPHAKQSHRYEDILGEVVE